MPIKLKVIPNKTKKLLGTNDAIIYAINLQTTKAVWTSADIFRLTDKNPRTTIMLNLISYYRKEGFITIISRRGKHYLYRKLRNIPKAYLTRELANEKRGARKHILRIVK